MVIVFLTWRVASFDSYVNCVFFAVSFRVRSFGSQDYLSNHKYFGCETSFLVTSYTIHLVGMHFCFLFI